MNKQLITILTCCFLSLSTYSNDLVIDASDRMLQVEKRQSGNDSISILSAQYAAAIEKLAHHRDSVYASPQLSMPSPYLNQILFTPTYLGSVLHQMFTSTQATSPFDDQELQRVAFANRALAKLYSVNAPLVTQTEEELKAQGTIRTDVNEKLQSEANLAAKAKETTLLPTSDEKVVVVTRRPNFWKFSGYTSMNFNQSYFSDNWKGGENTYSSQIRIQLKSNFDNMKKVTWNTTLDAELGFQTTKSDKNRVFRPNANMLRLTTNFGYKMYKTLYYSNQIKITTPIVPKYKANTNQVELDFLSPLDVTIGPGIRYNIAYGKKKRFTGELNIAPLAYNVRYVQRNSIVTNHGIRPNHNSRHRFGPTISLNTTWKIMDQITWRQRLDWFSDLHMTRIEWEHNIDFRITKLISANISFYPKFDDSSKEYKRKKDGKYLMFRELTGIGLSYNF